MKSNCCNAEVVLHPILPGDCGSEYYVCSKCKKYIIEVTISPNLPKKEKTYTNLTTLRLLITLLLVLLLGVILVGYSLKSALYEAQDLKLAEYTTRANYELFKCGLEANKLDEAKAYNERNYCVREYNKTLRLIK